MAPIASSRRKAKSARTRNRNRGKFDIAAATIKNEPLINIDSKIFPATRNVQLAIDGLCGLLVNESTTAACSSRQETPRRSESCTSAQAEEIICYTRRKDRKPCMRPAASARPEEVLYQTLVSQLPHESPKVSKLRGRRSTRTRRHGSLPCVPEIIREADGNEPEPPSTPSAESEPEKDSCWTPSSEDGVPSNADSPSGPDVHKTTRMRLVVDLSQLPKEWHTRNGSPPVRRAIAELCDPLVNESTTLACSSRQGAPRRSESCTSAQAEEIICYTRRKDRTPCMRPAASARPEEACSQTRVSQLPLESPKVSKLRGRRSTRTRRRGPPPCLLEIIREADDYEPEPAEHRRRKENPKYYSSSFVRLADYCSAQDDSDLPEGTELEEGGAVSLSQGILDHAEKASSLEAQIDAPRAGKAPKVLATESRPPVPNLQDETLMCPQTLQGRLGECEVDGYLSTSIAESEPEKDSCWTPSSEDGVPSNADSPSGPDVHKTTRMRLVVDLSQLPKEWHTRNGSPPFEGVAFNAKIKLKKKLRRPKVKKPDKVKMPDKVKKPDKVKMPDKVKKPDRVMVAKLAKIAKASKRKQDASWRGGSSAGEVLEPAIGWESWSSKRQRWQNIIADLPAEPTVQIPDMTMNDFLPMASDRSTFTAEKFCVHLPILSPSRRISSQQQECKDYGGKFCGHIGGFEQRTGPSPILGEACSGSCSSMDESPPSTPRGNVSTVSGTGPLLSSPSFAHHEDSTDSDGDWQECARKPTRRMRSRVMKTRRTLFSEMELAEADDVYVPYFEMTDAQKRQHAWALSRDSQYSEDPMGLVEELTRGVPKHLRSSMKAEATKLVMHVMEQDSETVGTTDQHWKTAAPLSQLSNLTERNSAAEQGRLQLVVYGQKSNELVVHRKMTPKLQFRPQVVLDRMTLDCFDRLMLQGGGAKEVDYGDENFAETRRWWENRAHRFIGIMREVQGDRKFSKWKGSVMDSIVGTFLTQNVSDYLSSNAFMKMVARFPARGPLTASRKSNADILALLKSFENMPTRDATPAVSDEGRSVEPMESSRIYKDLITALGEVHISSRDAHHSVIEDKFKHHVKEDFSQLTPAGTEKVLAATLRAILGKQTTERDTVLDGPVMPLELMRRKKSGIKRRVNRIKASLLRGDQRALFEASYRSQAENRGQWAAFRDKVLSPNLKVELPDPLVADSVDWEAVRHADVSEICDLIKTRGQGNVQGGRIKAFIDTIHREQNGSFDLDWVRKLSPVDAQKFLMSVRGLGIKSVECIRLLSLHHASFPVDVNVGRILVRLGWVPLEPLPEEMQLHSLESYPREEQIQKYIWPRLCTLDQETLYEFHYQLITFGKVFCTKTKPNCTECPMRSECAHYESAYNVRAKPLLQGPEDQADYSVVPLMSRPSIQPYVEDIHTRLMLGQNAGALYGGCIPIIEEPDSPDYVPDIEDWPFPYERDLADAVQNVSEESLVEGAGQVSTSESIEPDGVEDSPVTPDGLNENVGSRPSQELVLLPPEAASSPAPPLKAILRLRTIHYVYELPDHHPLLAKMDKRDAEDPCFYVLAIWNPDEVPESMPKISDDDVSNPFAGCQPEKEESVRGTLLIPCRTAMKGSFPLNGTYFQVNEVFADHASSEVPIDVPRTSLWNLKRRFVYFSTSVPSIFKGMSQEEIQCCFKKGYVCVRAFDRTTRLPQGLAPRLHISGAKIVQARASSRRASQSKPAE